MKPNVSILHYSALPVIGGVENVIADHSRLLLRAGYPVTILTGRGGTSPAQAGANVIVIPEIASEYPENQEISRALDQGSILPQFRELQTRIELSLTAALPEQGILIVHNALNAHYNMPLTAALYGLLEVGGLPLTVAWVHDICRYVNPHSGFEQRYGTPWDLLRTYHPEIRYEAVSVRRQRMLADTLACPPERIGVIPNGVAPETLLGLSDLGESVVKDFRLYEADLILLMPVRVTRAKNIEFALTVTAALKQAGQKVRLVVTGPPDPHSQDSQEYYQQLLAQRRALAVEQEAAFMYEGVSGHPMPLVIESGGVAELYRLADVVLMPSLREGFGLPVLEAGLTRAAIFTTEIPAVDEVGADGVHLIADGESAEQLAARIVEWAERDMGQRLRRRVRQQYTWQAIFERDIEPLMAECALGVKEQV